MREEICSLAVAIERSGTARWIGNVARGHGTLDGGSGVLHDIPFTLPGRIEQDSQETNPEELLALAHAGCFAMALASQLVARKAEPQELVVEARVVLDQVDGLNRIVASTLSVDAAVDVADDVFSEAVSAADGRCPFSALVRASGTVSVDAHLRDAKPA
jgi:osmotically inducible protein OsmC